MALTRSNTGTVYRVLVSDLLTAGRIKEAMSQNFSFLLGKKRPSHTSTHMKPSNEQILVQNFYRLQFKSLGLWLAKTLNEHYALFIHKKYLY